MSKPFEIGICMAGAVSAGAYTAGAMDYLIEALDDWESRRGQSGVPSHDVIIKAIGGASAGGMTGIIAASALNNPITPVRNLGSNILEEHPENKFYHTWVDLTTADMFPLMLGNDDIQNGKIYSLLNSNFIDQIAERAIQVDTNSWIHRNYVYPKLKLFTTLTNLKGFNYNVDFGGTLDNNDYLISRHNDYATFILNQSSYQGDGWIPLDFKDGLNTEIAKNAAMATGAFPIGLRSRKLSRPGQYVNELQWQRDITDDFPVKEDPYKTLNVDGGMINNEPFYRVGELVDGIDYDYNKFRGTVLMIDPFPSDVEKISSEEDKDDLFSVVGSTLSAMLGQLRTKPEVIKETMDEDNAAQFQIAPKRDINGTSKEGSGAIACGFLGGFGGFIHKEFRIHDYFLGRANCEWFLREHFCVPISTTNSIFKDGYANIPEDQFVSKDGKWRQIIPIFQPKGGKKYLPQFENGSDWPVRKEQDVDRFRKLIKKRAGKLVMNVANYSWQQRLWVGLGNWAFLKGKVANTVLDTIKDSMKEHQLLK